MGDVNCSFGYRSFACSSLTRFLFVLRKGKGNKIKKNMGVFQEALMAWATDYFGEFLSPKVVGEVLDPEGPLAYYFPGGKPVEEEKLGSLPVNPYTGFIYNSEYEELFYGGFSTFKAPDEKAKVWAGDSNYSFDKKYS